MYYNMKTSLRLAPHLEHNPRVWGPPANRISLKHDKVQNSPHSPTRKLRLISHVISAKLKSTTIIRLDPASSPISTRPSLPEFFSVDSIHATAPYSSYRPSDRLNPSSQMREDTSLPQHIPPFDSTRSIQQHRLA